MDFNHDQDPLETREWVDSLRAVLAVRGAHRANFLLEKLMEEARREGAYIPHSLNTAYVNTIPLEKKEHSPGDHEIEERISAVILWNALAIVLRANKESSELGGHIASYQSAATLYVMSRWVPSRSLSDRLHARMTELPSVMGGASELPNNCGAWVRVLGGVPSAFRQRYTRRGTKLVLP